MREARDAAQRDVRPLVRGRAEPVDPDRRDAELPGGLDVVEDALGDVHVPDLAAMVLAEDLPVPVRRLVRADLTGDDRVVEQVAVGVREEAESPTARTRGAQARTHVVEDRPLRKRSRKGARLALG